MARSLIPGLIFLPFDTTYPKVKVEINGEDVNSDMTFGEAILTATNNVPYANIKLDNRNGKFNSKWNPESEKIDVNIYFEYATPSNFTTYTPTYKIYSGKLDYAIPSLTNQGYIMKCFSRTAPELADIRMSIDFSSTNISDAIKEVITKVNADVGYTVITEGNIGTTIKSTSANYREERPINILADLCERADFFGRINTDLSYDANEKGSEICQRESIASPINVFSCPGFGKDPTRVFNNIKGYGPEKDGCLILWTDAGSLAPWRKDMVVNDTAIEDLDQLKDRLQKEKENNEDAEDQGTIVCDAMPYLLPGQSVNTFIQYVYSGVPYINQVHHVFSMSGVETKVSAEELEKGGLRLIKNNQRDIREKQTFNNPNGMKYCFHFTFDNDDQVATHSDTATSNGSLIISSGDSGIMTSIDLDIPETCSKAEIRFFGNDECDDCVFKATLDNGSNYTTIVPGTKGNAGEEFTITNTGKKVRLKIEMESSVSKPNPTINSCVVLCKP